MGKILYEGLQDTHADFEFARRQWKKLGIEKDFDDAYNDYFEKHKDDDDWQDPVYSEDAWNEMVDSAKGKGKNESYVSTLGLRKYLMKKNAEDNGIELSDKMKDYLKDAPELEEELDINKMGLRKYLNDKSRDRLNKDRLNRDKLNESEFHDEINQIYDDDPYVEHVKDEVDRLYAENDSFRERVDDWFDLHFPEEPDWQVNIGTLTHEELFQMLNDLGYRRIMGEGLNEGDLLGDDWNDTPYGFRELEYKGYTITDDNGSGFAPTSFSVDYAGDELLFDSLEDAKEFIDGLGNEDFGVEEGLNEESNSRFEEVKDELRELLNARKNGEIGHETFNSFISKLKQKYPGLPIEDLENEVLDEIYGKQSESLTEGKANPYANCQSDVDKLEKALKSHPESYSDIYVRDTEGGKYQPYVGFTYKGNEDEDEMEEEVDVLFNADGSLLVQTTYGDHKYKSVDDYMRDEFYDFSESGDDFYDESLAEEVKWVREKDYTCRDIFKNGIANALTSNGFGFGKSGKITLPVCGIHNSLIDENGNTKDLYTNTFNSLAINFKSKKKFVKDITPEQRENIKRDILALKNDAQKFVDVIFNDRKNTIYVLFDEETNYNKGWKQVDESLNEAPEGFDYDTLELAPDTEVKSSVENELETIKQSLLDKVQKGLDDYKDRLYKMSDSVTSVYRRILNSAKSNEEKVDNEIREKMAKRFASYWDISDDLEGFGLKCHPDLISHTSPDGPSVVFAIDITMWVPTFKNIWTGNHTTILTYTIFSGKEIRLSNSDGLDKALEILVKKKKDAQRNIIQLKRYIDEMKLNRVEWAIERVYKSLDKIVSEYGFKVPTNESLTEGAMTNGSYSLYNGWVKVPDKDSIPDEYPDLEPEYSEWVKRAESLETIEDIDSFIDDVYKLRQQGLLNSGEYGKENLIFKELRNNGYLQKAKDMKVEKQNKEMSLESLKEGVNLNEGLRDIFWTIGALFGISTGIIRVYTRAAKVAKSLNEIDELTKVANEINALDKQSDPESEFKSKCLFAAICAYATRKTPKPIRYIQKQMEDNAYVYDGKYERRVDFGKFNNEIDRALDTLKLDGYGLFTVKETVPGKTLTDDDILNKLLPNRNKDESLKEAYEGQFAGNFLSDADKMLDFYSMSDEDFLYEYDYMTQEECDATSEALKYIQENNPKLWDKYEDIAYDFDDRGYEIGSDDPELVAVCKEMSDYVDGLTDSTPIDYNESINEEEVLVEDGENDRAQELADYLEIDVDEVNPTRYDDKEFETPEGDFLVLTYDEAIEYAEEDVLNLIDDMGLQSFSKDYQDFIIDNFVDSSFINEVQNEEVSYYRDEEGDEEFAEELENMSEVEFCRYLVDNFGHDDFAKMVKDHIDWNAVAEDVVATDGPANSLARYDGEEIELDTYYAYRTN